MVIFPEAHFVCRVMSSNLSSSLSVRIGFWVAANRGGDPLLGLLPVFIFDVRDVVAGSTIFTGSDSPTVATESAVDWLVAAKSLAPLWLV